MIAARIPWDLILLAHATLVSWHSYAASVITNILALSVTFSTGNRSVWKWFAIHLPLRAPSVPRVAGLRLLGGNIGLLNSKTCERIGIVSHHLINFCLGNLLILCTRTLALAGSGLPRLRLTSNLTSSLRFAFSTTQNSWKLTFEHLLTRVFLWKSAKHLLRKVILLHGSFWCATSSCLEPLLMLLSIS